MAQMKCDVHPDRGGILFVDLPSIGVRRWGCFECRANFDKAMLNTPRTAARDGRNPWPNYDERNDTDIGGRNIRTAEANHRAHFIARKDTE